LVESIEKYHRSVNRAQIADLMARMTGGQTELVSYDEVARRLKAYQQKEMGTHMVPLEQIVGSVGRYRDFTRAFLPRTAVNAERWARVDAVFQSLEGYPPIDLFKIGEVYFVRDGNHRVSVARANGLTHIEAYVTELETAIDLTLEDFERDQWLRKVERAAFLKETGLDELRPGHGIELTEAGRYEHLLHHIEVHHYLGNLDRTQAGDERQLDWDEAVASWYDNVYLPVVEAVHRFNILKDFPKRTEADLYLWLAFHREELAKRFGLAPLSPETAVTTFMTVHSDQPFQRALRTMRFRLYQALGNHHKPFGMSEDDLAEARARYDAGERTLAEVEAGQESALESEVGKRADALLADLLAGSASAADSEGWSAADPDMADELALKDEAMRGWQHWPVG
jgi:hypothetical protein